MDSNTITPAATATRPLRVLLVDDDDVVRRVLGRMLTEAGHTVVVAESSRDALAQLAATADDPQAAFDVLCTDLVMPGLRGEILAQEVIDSYPGVGVVVVSGWLLPDTRGRLPAAPRVVTVAKPLTSDRDLLTAIHAAVPGTEEL